MSQIKYDEKTWAPHQVIGSADLNRMETAIKDTVSQVNTNTVVVETNKKAIQAQDARLTACEAAAETAKLAQEAAAAAQATAGALSAQMVTMQGTVDQAKEESAEAKAAADAAAENVESLRGTIATAVATAEASKGEADMAMAKAAELEATVQTAVDKADEALGKAQDLKNEAEASAVAADASAQAASSSETNADAAKADAEAAKIAAEEARDVASAAADSAEAQATAAQEAATAAQDSEHEAAAAARSVAGDAATCKEAQAIVEAKAQDVIGQAQEIAGMVTTVNEKATDFATKSQEALDAIKASSESIAASKDAIDTEMSKMENLAAQVSADATTAANAAKSASDDAAALGIANEVKEELTTLQNTITEKLAAVDTAVESKTAELTGLINELKSQVDAINSCTCNNAATAALIDALSARIKGLEDAALAAKVDSGTKIDMNAQTTVNRPNDVVVLSAEEVVVDNKTLTAKEIIATDVKVESSKLTMKSEDGVTITGMEATGAYPKTSGNTPLSINTNGAVAISNSKLDQTCYNAAEVGLTAGYTPTEVLFENLHGTECANNFLNVFDVAEGGRVVVRNCSVDKCSNFIRLSCKSNTKYDVILENCEMGECDNGEWHGWICCQDYTSAKDGKDPMEVKQFAGMNITLINCTIGGKPMTETDPAKICGTKDNNQVVIVCNSPDVAVQPYDSGLYPNVTIAYM